MSHGRQARTYWTNRGQTYEAQYVDTEARLSQEHTIRRVIRDLEFRSVLDVGCGFGRIGVQVVHDHQCHYTGIDLSPDMLRSARSKIEEGRFVRTDLADFEPGHQYDLVLAIEVLMHIKPSRVARAIGHLRRLSRSYIVTSDWTKPFAQNQQDSHNWIHDYSALYGDSVLYEVPVSHQTVYLVESAP